MYIELKGYKVDEDIAYKFKRYDICCQKLSDNPTIVFAGEVLEDEGEDYSFPPAMAIVQHTSDYSYGEYYESEDYHKINYCPHCGKKINIQVLEVEDVTEEYNLIQRQVTELCIKANKCDSKSREKELRKQINELSDRSNWYLKSGEYDS